MYIETEVIHRDTLEHFMEINSQITLGQFFLFFFCFFMGFNCKSKIGLALKCYGPLKYCPLTNIHVLYRCLYRSHLQWVQKFYVHPK